MAVGLDGMDLTDAQWAVLEPTFRPRRRPDGRGRPWTDPRALVNGVRCVLRTCAPADDLPRRYPPYQTCHRRSQHRQRTGRLGRLLQRLAGDLRDRGKLDLTEGFVDAIFAWAKRGGLPLVPPAVARGARSWRSATAMVSLSRCTHRRWKIEHVFEWLHSARRLIARREYHVENFLGMVRWACARILLRHL